MLWVRSVMHLKHRKLQEVMLLAATLVLVVDMVEILMCLWQEVAELTEEVAE
jgi:hypothetical protein